MARSMPSEQLQLLIAGYVLGDLSSEEVEEFEQLLANDSAIADEVARMQKALEISYAPPEVAPPPICVQHFWRQIVIPLISKAICTLPQSYAVIHFHGGWGWSLLRW